MPVAAVATLIISAVLILALAAYLIKVILTLRSVIDLLGIITFGVRAIAYQTRPVNVLLTEIGEEAAAIDGALASLLSAKLVQREEAS